MSTNTPHCSSVAIRQAQGGHARRVAGIVVTSVVAIAVAVAATALGPSHAAESSAAAGARHSFADLVERVQPAVVNVATKTRIAQVSAPPMPFRFPEGSPFAERFREFFDHSQPGKPRADAPRVQGVGSGFFIDAQGHVVTNFHVVKGADEIQLTLHDGTELTARMVGRDEKTDLALLKVDHDAPLPYVTFGSSDKVRVGDWVVAVGSPFGLGGTVTAGILSARGRDIRSGPFDDFLQIDAPINRGNSGGPLFDQGGEVIGVNTAIFSPTGGSVGIGFAIPAELAAEVVEALKADGRVSRGWMGVSIQALSKDLAASFGLEATAGALVSSVIDDSPAARAGVQVGDVIVAFGGERIESVRELPRVVAGAKAGDDVPVEVLRNGEPRTLTLRVGRMPGEDEMASASKETSEQATLGLQLARLDGEARARLGIEGEVRGVLIERVAAGSAAARQGLRSGDLILRVGREPVSEPAQVLRAVREATEKGRESLVILVSRDGNERFVAVPFSRG